MEIQELTWKDVRDSVHAVNPELAGIIDDWNPDDSYTFFKMGYQYGDVLLENGSINIPMENGELYPLQHPQVPEKIKEKLSYSSFPLSLSINYGNEVFLEHEDKIVSLAYFSPGFLLGLWESIDTDRSFFPKNMWSVCAGARSLFFLPKISEQGAHERIKKTYGIRLPLPKKLFEHSNVFKEIIRSKNCKTKWCNELLYFSKKWLEPDEKNIGWLRFHHHLLEQAWKMSDYNRNKLCLDRIWQQFSVILEAQGTRPTPYILDILKHLIAMGTGVVPGHVAAAETNIPGPVSVLQKIYTEVYGLKKYIPTMMMPYHFSEGCENKHIYYSLHAATVFESNPRPNTQISLMKELRALKDLISCFIEEAKKGKLLISGTPIEWLVNSLSFNYFHCDLDVYHQILPSKNMINKDRALIQVTGMTKGRKFAEASPFLRGCVRISKQ